MALEESHEQSQLHFLVIPLGSSGHYIPTIDMAKLLAQHGVKITIVTTPASAIRFGSVLDQATQSGLPITFLKFPFPSTEFGLPEGCETIDDLPRMGLIMALLSAYSTQQQHVEQYIEKLSPKPSCIISDSFLLWPSETARKFQIPRIIFDSMNCFTQMCNHTLHQTKVHETVGASESFVLPGLPDHIELKRCQLPSVFNTGLKGMDEYNKQILISELEAYGVVVNSFQESEPAYADQFRKLRGGKAWCIGPLSLCHADASETADRGNKSSINKNECLKWLDSQEKGSVTYACLGSISQVKPDQLIELALALEASNKPFIWVARAGTQTSIIEKWIDDEKFEERTKDRALLIRGWAPQLLVLSHPSIGAFLTHCGSNSVVEGICGGVPLITWPQYQEQFYNEKFVVNVLKTGVSINGEQKKPKMAMTSEEIVKAIETVMDQGKEGEERRKRAKELGKMAYKAIEGGGSSHENIKRLIHDIRNHATSMKSTHA